MARWVDSARRDDAGIAMVTVLSGGIIVFLALMLMMRNALAEYEDARYEEREDVMLAHMEGIADRYLAKVQNDAAYHYRWVDEFERARTCNDVTSGDFGTVVAGGNAWLTSCGSWSYDIAPSADTWQRHPLTNDADDGQILMEVQPAGDRGYLELTIVGNIPERNQWRSMSVEIFPPAVNAFQWMSELDLRFTPGATTEGPVYSGHDVYYAGPPTGTAEDNVYADGAIVEAPTYSGRASGFDSTGGVGDVRAEFVEPLVFDDYWDDLVLIQEAACLRGGICLDNPLATAYLVHPFMQGGDPKIAVWTSTVANSDGCLSPDEWWWRWSQSPTNNWGTATVYDYPGNGVLWANETIVLGNRGVTAPTGAMVVGDQITMLAGTATDPMDIVLAGNISYNAGGGDDIIGVVATRDIVIDPLGEGQINLDTFELSGAFMAMAGEMRATRSCGEWGALLDDAGTIELRITGSIATRNTGDVASFFVDRNYSYDQRFHSLAPPLFPRVTPSFSFVDWREIPIPDWARS